MEQEEGSMYGQVTSTPGSSGDAVFPNAFGHFHLTCLVTASRQDNYIGAYEFDYNTSLSAGDLSTVGITSYTTNTALNGPTSNHQVHPFT